MASVDSTTMPSKTLIAQCHCKAVHFSTTVAEADLPLPVHLCHCSICRRTHGTLCVFHAGLPMPATPTFIAPSSMSALSSYQHHRAKSIRYFCSKCGAHIGDCSLASDTSEGGQWVISTSLFTDHSEEFFKISSHMETKHDPPGGIFELLREVNGRAISHQESSSSPTPSEYKPTFPMKGDSDTLPDGIRFQPYVAGQADMRRGAYIYVRCHCGGVCLRVMASEQKNGTVSPYAERCLVAPSNDSKPWKYLAALDLSTVSRLTSGAHVVGWMYVPREYIRGLPEKGKGKPPPADALHPSEVSRRRREPCRRWNDPVDEPEPTLSSATMKTYESGEEAVLKRMFCGVCGATVMKVLEEDKRRRKGAERLDGLVGIAVGLLNAQGIMAKNWVSWTSKVEGEDEGRDFDAAVVESLLKGLAGNASQKNKTVEDDGDAGEIAREGDRTQENSV